VGVGVGAGVGVGVGWTVGVGVGLAVGRGVGRGVGRTPGWDSGPEVDPPPAVRGGVVTADGVAVGPGRPPVGDGSIVGLAGAVLGVAVAAGEAVGDADDTGPLAAGVATGEAPPVSGGVDGRAAVSPPSAGDGVDPPNAPTASAIAARRRFRIPRATTSRARWAIVTNDRDSSSGRGTRRLKETASRFRSYNASTGNRVSW
jgi:hypothetical protein